MTSDAQRGVNETDELRLLADAKRGDGGALTELLNRHRRSLFGYIYRMVTHREDAEDLLQDVQLRAVDDIGKFRGRSRFRTWLFGIATHACIDHLRRKVRWREQTQIDAEIAGRADRFRMAQVQSLLASPEVTYEIREHIAFCFSCVARTLEPEAQAALMLREVVGLSLSESAEALGLSEPRYRHRLSAARRKMQQGFDGKCQLVNKTGACWQCRGLRELAPPEKRGVELTRIELAPGMAMTPEHVLDARIEIARSADLAFGRSAALHDDLFAAVDDAEESLG